MSILNFPETMNLANQKKSLASDMAGGFLKIRSDNPSYSSTNNDTIRIEIPTGRRGMWLHPSDSFITMTLNVTSSVSTSLRIDNSCLSLFRGARVIHGSTMLVNQSYSNRVWNTLFDYQVNLSERFAKSINMLTDETDQFHGANVATANSYQMSFNIPISLLGGNTSESIPLGWLGAASLYLELDLEAGNRAFTNLQVSNGYGAITDASGAPIVSYTLDDIHYHAKVSQIPDQYDSLIMSSFGGVPISIHSYDFRCEMINVPSGTTSINSKLGFNFSSLNYVLWWLTQANTANGDLSGNNLAHAISQRQCGVLRDYFLSFNGMQVPPYPISCSLNGKTTTAGYMFPASAYSHLEQCFNQTSSVDKGGILDITTYANTTNAENQDDTIKKFIAGICTERGSMDGDKYFSGYNSLSQNINLQINWDTALSATQHLYVVSQYDVVFNLVDGLLFPMA